MTTETAVPTVDRIGTVVELVAVKYGTSPIAERAPDGTLVAFEETWDPDSVTLPTPGTKVRLLTYHDRRRPIGWLDHFTAHPDGIHATGRLSGSTAHLDQLRALAADGLLSDVSIAFSPNIDTDVWSAPRAKNGLARVLRRRATIREVSLVDQAALAGSRLLAITQPATTPVDNPALREFDATIRSGYGGRVRLDEQIANDAERRRRLEVLAESDRLAAEGERWKHLTAAPGPDPEPTALALAVLDGQRERARTWEEREATLLATRPADIARTRWLDDYNALMREKYAWPW